MKKILTIMIAAALVLSMAACSNKPAEIQPDESVAAGAITETPAPEESPEVPDKSPEETKTVGNTLLAAFKANSGGSALSVAESLSANPAIKVPVGAMAIEPGYLTGFDNTEIKGFKEGAVFMPMIGTIPFVGYVFTLENAADAPAFIANLKSAANLRWNICTSADEMVAGSAGNKVFFVMCPTSFEE